MQVEAGLIPDSHKIRLEWMYQNPNSGPKTNTAEEYLLGKRIDEKKELAPVIKESTVNEDYENFIRLTEDPLVGIKEKELAERAKLTNNPFKLRKMRDDLLQKLFPNESEREKIASFMNEKERRQMEKKRRKKERRERKLREKKEKALGDARRGRHTE